jgi:hypothetical protein
VGEKEKVGGHFWADTVIEANIITTTHSMDATVSPIFMQRWNVGQNELIPYLGDEIGHLAPLLEQRSKKNHFHLG